MNKSIRQILFLIFFTISLLFSASTANGQGCSDFSTTYIEPGWSSACFGGLPFIAAAIAFDSEDNLYTTNIGHDLSHQYIEILTFKAPEYDFTNPSVYSSYARIYEVVSGLDFDDKGNLFASEVVREGNPNNYPLADVGLIREIYNKGRKVSDPIIFAGIANIDGDHSFRPTGIAATGSETLYFTARKWSMPNWGNLYRIDSFKKYEPNTEPSIVEEGSVYTSIIIDLYGKLYYGSRYPDSSVYTHNPYTGDLVRIAQFNYTDGKYVEELAIDSKGNIYALEGDVGTDEQPTYIIKLIPPHVLINSCDTGIVEWELDASGATISGIIEEECAPILNHDEFLSCVAELAGQLKGGGIITGQEMGAIVKCAGKTEIP